MPRRADVPCIRCGRLLPTYRDSAPPDRRRCGACVHADAARWDHGTRTGYERERCRCDRCRAWAAAQARTGPRTVSALVPACARSTAEERDRRSPDVRRGADLSQPGPSPIRAIVNRPYVNPRPRRPFADADVRLQDVGSRWPGGLRFSSGRGCAREACRKPP